MKFLISSQEFNYLLSKINLIPLKPAIPLLSYLLVEAYGDQLIISATDLNIGIRCYADADANTLKILEEGATVLPGRKLAQLARELTAPMVEIFSSPQEMTTLISGSSRFKLHGLEKSLYPALPDLTDTQFFTISQAQLKELLYRTAFAASKEENRYALTGVLMQILNGRVIFTGTDGKKLARASAPIDIDPLFTNQSIIPAKAVEEIMKNLTREEEHAKIFLMADKIAFEANQTRIIAKLLLGDYPDVNRIIPEQSPIEITLHREELSTLLRQISLFTTESHYSVRFSFTQGELQLTANTREVGEGHVSMPVNYFGEPLQIAFNPSFFLEILRHCKEETVSIALTDSYNPGKMSENLHGPNASGFESIFVIMPMRLEE